jgi:hypothetical protein
MKQVTITLTPEQAQSVFSQHLANMRAEQDSRPAVPPVCLKATFFNMIDAWPEGEIRKRAHVEHKMGHKFSNKLWYDWVSDAILRGKLEKVSHGFYRKVVS